MWQEILAVDSHFSKLRVVETQNVSQSQQPSLSILPSLYLKRRLQLLQVQPTKTPTSPMDKMECLNERDEATFVTHRPGKQTLDNIFQIETDCWWFCVLPFQLWGTETTSHYASSCWSDSLVSQAMWCLSRACPSLAPTQGVSTT
jgi:hypothetical protein